MDEKSDKILMGILAQIREVTGVDLVKDYQSPKENDKK